MLVGSLAIKYSVRMSVYSRMKKRFLPQEQSEIDKFHRNVWNGIMSTMPSYHISMMRFY